MPRLLVKDLVYQVASLERENARLREEARNLNSALEESQKSVDVLLRQTLAQGVIERVPAKNLKLAPYGAPKFEPLEFHPQAFALIYPRLGELPTHLL